MLRALAPEPFECVGSSWFLLGCGLLNTILLWQVPQQSCTGPQATRKTNPCLRVAGLAAWVLGLTSKKGTPREAHGVGTWNYLDLQSTQNNGPTSPNAWPAKGPSFWRSRYMDLQPSNGSSKMSYPGDLQVESNGHPEGPRGTKNSARVPLKGLERAGMGPFTVPKYHCIRLQKPLQVWFSGPTTSVSRYLNPLCQA